jgi:hypothetical protein
MNEADKQIALDKIAEARRLTEQAQELQLKAIMLASEALDNGGRRQAGPVMSARRKRRVRCTSEPAALVRCDCGNEMLVSHADLLSGRVTCCGQCGDRIPGHRCGEPEATS